MKKLFFIFLVFIPCNSSHSMISKTIEEVGLRKFSALTMINIGVAALFSCQVDGDHEFQWFCRKHDWMHDWGGLLLLGIPSLVFGATATNPIGSLLLASTVGLMGGKYLSCYQQYQNYPLFNKLLLYCDGFKHRDLFTVADFQSRAGFITSLIAAGHLALLNYPKIALTLGCVGSAVALSRRSIQDWENGTLFIKEFDYKPLINLNGTKDIIPLPLTTFTALLDLKKYKESKENSLGVGTFNYLANIVFNHHSYKIKNKKSFNFYPEHYSNIKNTYKNKYEAVISKISAFRDLNETLNLIFPEELMHRIESYFITDYARQLCLKFESKTYCSLLIDNLIKNKILVSHADLFNMLSNFDIYWSNKSKCYKAKSAPHKILLPAECNEFITALLHPYESVHRYNFIYDAQSLSCPGRLKFIWNNGISFSKTFTKPYHEGIMQYNHIVHYNEVLYNNNYNQNIHTKDRICNDCDKYWTMQDQEEFLAYKKSLSKQAKSIEQ